MTTIARMRGLGAASLVWMSALALGCASGVQDGSGGLGFGGPAGPGGPATADDDGSGSGDDGGSDSGDDGVDDGSAEGMVPSGACEGAETQSCFSGPASAAGVGACVEGTSACEDGLWGSCEAEVLPGVETCNGIDDDCNGTIDDGIDSGGACSTGMPGVCADGTMSCAAGVSSCTPVTAPSAEACDGVDNDCNGQTDEGNPGGGGSCVTGMSGICSAGTNTCVGGSIACQQNQSAGAEVCNDNLDNDCNGQTDENCSTCTHDICVTGGALVSGCEPCVTQICAADSFCCNNSWDTYCVDEVGSICGLSC